MHRPIRNRLMNGLRGLIKPKATNLGPHQPQDSSPAGMATHIGLLDLT